MARRVVAGHRRHVRGCVVSKVRLKLRLVPRPLGPLTLAEKRAAVARDFRAQPWIRGEGATFFTPERLAAMAQENEARRLKRKGRK